MKASREFCASLSYRHSIKRQHRVWRLRRLGAAAILGLVLCGVQTAAWCDDAPAASSYTPHKQPRVRVQFQPSEDDELVPRPPATTITRSHARSETDANPATTIKPNPPARQSIASKLGLNVRPGTTASSSTTIKPNTTGKLGSTAKPYTLTMPGTSIKPSPSTKFGTAAKSSTIAAKPLTAEAGPSKAKPDEWHAKAVKYQDTFTQSLAQRSGTDATSPPPAATASPAKTSPLAEAVQAKLLSLPAPPSIGSPSVKSDEMAQLESGKPAEKTSAPNAEAKNTEAKSLESNSKESQNAEAPESGEVAPAAAVDVKPTEAHAAIPADAAPVTERITSQKHKPAVLSLGDSSDSGNSGEPGNAKDPAPVAPAPVITAAQSRGLSKQPTQQVAAPVETPPRAGGMFTSPVGTAIGTAIAAPAAAATAAKTASAGLKDSTTEAANSEANSLRGWSAKPAASSRSAFDEPGKASLSSGPQAATRALSPARESNQTPSAFSPWASGPATLKSDASIPPAPSANESASAADSLAPADNPTVSLDPSSNSSEPPAALHAETTDAALKSVPTDSTAVDADVAAPRVVLQMVKMIGLQKPTAAGQSLSPAEPSRFTLKEPAKITEPAKLIEPAFGAALPAETATPNTREPAATSAAPSLAASPVEAKTNNAGPPPSLLDNSAAKDAPSTATNTTSTAGGALVSNFPAATAGAAPSPPSAFPMTVAEATPSPAKSSAPADNTVSPSSAKQLPTFAGQPASNATAGEESKSGSVVILRRESATRPSDKTAEAAEQSPAPPAAKSPSSGSRFAAVPADPNGVKAESNNSDSIAIDNGAKGKSVDSGTEVENHTPSDAKTSSGPFSLAELSKHVQVPALTGGTHAPHPRGSDEKAKLVSTPVPAPSDVLKDAKSIGSIPSALNSETGKAATSRLVVPPSAGTDAPSLLTAAPAPSPDQTKYAQSGSPTATGTPEGSVPQDFGSLAVSDAERISIAPRETRSIHLDGDATRAESHDPRVCDVIQFAPRELTFVGKQPGVTRIDCWQDGNPDKRKSYLVAVGVDPNKEQQVRDQFSKMRAALQDMYPDAGIKLNENNGSLVVSGTAASKAEAIAIISLVRRMQTVPVVDALTVEAR